MHVYLINFNYVSSPNWLGLQNQHAELVVRDYLIISPLHLTPSQLNMPKPQGYEGDLLSLFYKGCIEFRNYCMLFSLSLFYDAVVEGIKAFIYVKISWLVGMITFIGVFMHVLKGKTLKSYVIRLAFVANVYHLWIQRNPWIYIWLSNSNYLFNVIN